MIVRALPIRGTNKHVWGKKKYYPGIEYDVDDDLGDILIARGIAVKLKDSPSPFKRGPGRPRKEPSG